MTSDAPMTGPADKDELRNRLARAVRSRLFHDDIDSVSIGRDTSYPESLADALLPLIREHTAATVAAERERVAAAIEAIECDHYGIPCIDDDPCDQHLIIRDALRIIWEEPADG